MRFEWDARKNAANIRKHGIDFTDAGEVFENPLLARPDTREDYGENRWVGIGVLRGNVVVIVFAESGPDTVRIISVRKAKHDERSQYQQALQNELGPP